MLHTCICLVLGHCLVLGAPTLISPSVHSNIGHGHAANYSMILAYCSITALRLLTIRTWSCKGEKSSKQVRAVQHNEHICPWDPPEREQPKIFPAYSCTATVQDVCGNKQASRWSPLKKWPSVECFSFFMGPRAQLEHVPQLLIIPLTARHQQSPPSSNATWLPLTHSHHVHPLR
jgi:hypothetical protein